MALPRFGLVAAGMMTAACAKGPISRPSVPVPLPSSSSISAPTDTSVSTSPSVHRGISEVATLSAPMAVTSRKGAFKPIQNVSECFKAIKLDQQSAGRLAQSALQKVQAIASECASVTKMHAVSAPSKATQKQNSPPQSYSLKAEENHCYRIYAATSASITSLDILITDSEGRIAGESHSGDSTLVLPEGGAICFPSADNATVVVSVGGGEGDYAIQTWSD